MDFGGYLGWNGTYLMWVADCVNLAKCDKFGDFADF